MFIQSRSGGLYLDIRPNREAAARYGIDVGAIQDVIETAIGENNITTTIEGRRRFPVRVRYAPQYRRDPQDLANVLGDRSHRHTKSRSGKWLTSVRCPGRP